MPDTLSLLKLVNKLKEVERHTKATVKRAENSTEHTWSVAMYAWILEKELKEEFRQEINVNKMIKMALMHDLVEIETGDVSIWSKSERFKQMKKDRDNMDKVFSKFSPELSKEFHALWEEFDENMTLEAKIINGLDKLSGVIQRLITNQGWVSIPATTKDLDAIQLPKLKFSKTLLSHYKSLKEEAKIKGLIKDK